MLRSDNGINRVYTRASFVELNLYLILFRSYGRQARPDRDMWAPPGRLII
jgi:hypothetical protein